MLLGYLTSPGLFKTTRLVNKAVEGRPVAVNTEPDQPASNQH